MKAEEYQPKVRHNQEKIFKIEKISVCFMKSVSMKRLNNQARRKITDKIQRWKEIESNVQTKVLVL